MSGPKEAASVQNDKPGYLEKINKYSGLLTTVVVAVVGVTVALMIWTQFGTQQLEYLEKENKQLKEKQTRTIKDMEALYESIKQGQEWSWSVWVHTPRSIHNHSIREYNDPETVYRIRLLEQLEQNYQIKLRKEHLFAIAKFYFFNKEARDINKSKSIAMRFIKKYPDPSSIEMAFLEAIVLDITSTPRDPNDEQQCDGAIDKHAVSRAIQKYQFVIKSEQKDNPYYISSLNNLAQLYSCTKRHDKYALKIAAQYVQKALTLKPANTYTVLDTLARVRLAQGLYDDAIAAQIRALKETKGSKDHNSRRIIRQKLVKILQVEVKKWKKNTQCEKKAILDKVLSINHGLLGDQKIEVEHLKEDMQVLCK